MTRIKKKIYTRKPYININIDNENNQQSKNKYIPPFPQETKSIGSIGHVPLAYEPYNDTSYLWRDQSIGQGIRNNVRPPPEYEGATGGVPEAPPEIQEVEQQVEPQVPPPVAPQGGAGRPNGTTLEKRIVDYLISQGRLQQEDRYNFFINSRQDFFQATGIQFSTGNRIRTQYNNWLRDRYPELPQGEV